MLLMQQRYFSKVQLTCDMNYFQHKVPWMLWNVFEHEDIMISLFCFICLTIRMAVWVPFPPTGPLPINAHNSRISEPTIARVWSALANGPTVSKPWRLVLFLSDRLQSRAGGVWYLSVNTLVAELVMQPCHMCSLRSVSLPLTFRDERWTTPIVEPYEGHFYGKRLPWTRRGYD